MVSFWTCQDLLRDRSQRETPRLLTPAKKPGCDHLEGKTGEEQAQVLTVSELLSAFLHHEGGAGSVPGGGAKILHALLPKNQTIKQKQYWYKFNKKVKKKVPSTSKKFLPQRGSLTELHKPIRSSRGGVVSQAGAITRGGCKIQRRRGEET